MEKQFPKYSVTVYYDLLIAFITIDYLMKKQSIEKENSTNRKWEVDSYEN